MDFSHICRDEMISRGASIQPTNSTDNLNNLQSQSSECLVSPIVDSMKIDSSSRRASLRSSKRKDLIVTGITESSSRRASLRSSKRKNIIETGITDSSSRRASLRSSKRKNLIETGITDSSSRQLDDLSHQVEPNLMCREIEKEGKCVAEEKSLEDITKDIGGEKGVPLEVKSISVVGFPSFSLKQTLDMAVHQDNKAYQAPRSSQVEPSLRHEVIEKGENIATEESLGDGITVPLMEEVGEKEESLVEKPISMVSLTLTEINKDVDEDDEVGSQGRAMDIVEGYTVKPESKIILRKILTRYGDIAKNCIVSTMKFRSALLEMICGIILELQGKDLNKIKEDVLHNNINLVDEIKNLKVDIEWLRGLLVDMLEAKQNLTENFGKLKEKKDINKKTVEDAKTKLAECQERKWKLLAEFMEANCKEVEALLVSTLDEEIACIEELEKAIDESTETAETILCAISKVQRFLDRPPVDGLL